MVMSFPRGPRVHSIPQPCSMVGYLSPDMRGGLSTETLRNWAMSHSCSSLRMMRDLKQGLLFSAPPDGQTASGGGSRMLQHAFCPRPAFPAMCHPRARLHGCCSVTISLLFCSVTSFFLVTMSYPTLRPQVL